MRRSTVSSCARLQTALVAAVLAPLLAAPLPAEAATQFPSAYTRKVKLSILVSGLPQVRYFLVAQDGNLYAKPEQGHWTKIGAPTGTTLFDYTFGATGVQATGLSCEASVLAVGLDYKVWEYRYCSGAGDWYNHGNGGGGLWDNPPIVAALRSATNEILVAVVENQYQHLRILRFPVGGGQDSWHDAGGSVLVDDTASLDMNLEPSPDGNGSNDNDAHVWVRDTSGNLQQYIFTYPYNTGSWQSHGAPAAGVTTVSPVGIQAHWGVSSYYNVFVRGSDYHLWLRRNQQGWGWQQWRDLGAPNGDTISGGRNALAYPRGSSDRVYVIGMTNQTVYRCEYTFQPSACNTWTNGGIPPDSVNGARWGLLADSVDRIYLNATAGPWARYVDAVDIMADEHWRSHLAPVDEFTTELASPFSLSVNEWDLAEHNGTLLATACEGFNDGVGIKIPIWRSRNDGSSWDAAPMYPFGSETVCDPNVAFDAAGVAYATRLDTVCVDPPQCTTYRNLVRIVASDNITADNPQWTSPDYEIPLPPALPGEKSIDRPWLVADSSVPGRIYLTYDRQTMSYFTYCTGGIGCATGMATWCGPYATGVSEKVIISHGAAGALWFLFRNGSAAACAAPDPSYPLSWAVRRILGASSPQGCEAPTWTASECLYHTGFYPPEPPEVRPPGRNDGVGGAIQAARDTAGAALVVLKSYTDPATWSGDDTNACTASSAQCRANVFATWRSVAGWSGQFPPQMQRAHCDPGNVWRDHMLGTPLARDYANHMAGWLDWRDDPGLTDLYYPYSAVLGLSCPARERRWPRQGDWVYSLGHIEGAANARIHGHFVQEYRPGAGLAYVGQVAAVSPHGH